MIEEDNQSQPPSNDPPVTEFHFSYMIGSQGKTRNHVQSLRVYHKRSGVPLAVWSGGQDEFWGPHTTRWFTVSPSTSLRLSELSQYRLVLEHKGPFKRASSEEEVFTFDFSFYACAKSRHLLAHGYWPSIRLEQSTEQVPLTGMFQSE